MQCYVLWRRNEIFLFQYIYIYIYIYSVRMLADLEASYAQFLSPTVISCGHRISGIVAVENLGHV
jgi:hypothetical protein